MTIDDVEHYTREQREAIGASYPPHEREARLKGVPALGCGRIFPVTEESIAIDAVPIARHWPQITGLDFGWDHPTGRHIPYRLLERRLNFCRRSGRRRGEVGSRLRDPREGVSFTKS
jgi:hypothetical protein